MNNSKYFDDVLQLYIKRYETDRLNKSVYIGNYISRVFFIIKQFLKSLIYPMVFNNSKKNIKDKWLYVLTKNNISALEFLSENDSQYDFVTSIDKKVLLDDRAHRPFKLSFTSIFNIWLYEYIKLLFHTSNARFYFKYPHLFYLVYKFKKLTETTLKRYKPSLIVFANDINYESRVLNLEARSLNIPTVYIQHATVSNLYPPLNFDLALLEGEYSNDIYVKSDETKVELIGQPKFEKYKNVRKIIKKIDCIGVAFNTIDSIKQVSEICRYLNDNKYRVILRPHPRETRMGQLDWNFIHKISAKENSYDFLLQCDALIASDSSIHLEAVLINIPSIYYNLNEHYSYDYYSYVKNNVIREAKSKEEISAIIDVYKNSNNEKIYKQAKYYCFSIENDCKSEQIAINHINRLMKSNFKTSSASKN
jgi:hypothetical protein